MAERSSCRLFFRPSYRTLLSTSEPWVQKCILTVTKTFEISKVWGFTFNLSILHLDKYKSELSKANSAISTAIHDTESNDREKLRAIADTDNRYRSLVNLLRKRQHFSDSVGSPPASEKNRARKGRSILNIREAQQEKVEKIYKYQRQSRD